MNCPYRVHETITKVYKGDKETTTVVKILEECDPECAFFIDHQCGRAMSELSRLVYVRQPKGGQQS